MKEFFKAYRKISPNTKNNRITKATKIFFNCIKDKYDIIAELDKEFFEKYTKNILRHLYDQYEDTKEVVNRAVLDYIGYLSLFRFLESVGEFVNCVGWKEKP